MTFSGCTPLDRAQILSEALPYIQQFQGRTIVIKYGGAAMVHQDRQAEVLRDLVFLSCVGIRPVLVHGGGPEINTWLQKLAIPFKFVDGLRVTDAATMEVVEMVLVGKVNKQIVQLINLAGGSAVGLCGRDGNLIMARSQGRSDIGFVGEVNSINPALLQSLIEAGQIPVVSSVAADETGQAYNINADTVAGELAAALGAEKLVLLTDIDGLLRDKDDPSSLINQLDIPTARHYIESGIVAGGMIPKVQCCIRALAQGVRAAHIINGGSPHSLLLEILTDAGIGTQFVSSQFSY
ncbi:MAG: acetylglutamate kinase [Synechococcaceae cyanobacterium SM2_3_60]|nr:acetylglutamate kinase [Synechococcaceae cyanobacterium SM2_3_60]